jgi:hypothetical protein
VVCVCVCVCVCVLGGVYMRAMYLAPFVCIVHTDACYVALGSSYTVAHL